MAKVIIGGQVLSLVLALLVTPVFYAILDSFVAFTRRIGIRFSVEPPPPHLPEPHLHPEHAVENHDEPAASYA